MTKEYIAPSPATVVLCDTEPKRLALDLVYFDGGEVLLDEKDFDITKENLEQICDAIPVDGRSKPIYLPKRRLKNFNDLKDGMLVFSTWYDDSVVAMKVEGLDPEKKRAIGRLNDYFFGNLEFDKDMRHCWICNGFTGINTSAISKLELKT